MLVVKQLPFSKQGAGHVLSVWLFSNARTLSYCSLIVGFVENVQAILSVVKIIVKHEDYFEILRHETSHRFAVLSKGRRALRDKHVVLIRDAEGNKT
jgi:hypothetical protein